MEDIHTAECRAGECQHVPQLETEPPPDHRSADGYPVTVGAKFWNNDLRICRITAIGQQSRIPYADTGEFQTWHKHTDGISDTMTGYMRRYGRLARYCDGKDAENYEPGTDYSEIRHP